MKQNPRYYCAIGNRDWIKLRGERLPFWEFLDRQPNSWLISLAYQRHDVPEAPGRIWDCGAWSYRDQVEPALGKDKVTPQWALTRYLESAHHGDMLVAPDHMLLSGTDVAFRREWNATSAAEFIRACPSEYTPMGVVHGLDLEERLDAARHLLDLGYRALAVGGVAARNGGKRIVIEVVRQIREATAGARLHVLGLSSPDYVAAWKRIGVDSCDGSSHFKQAFTAGTFFATDHAGRMAKHQAVKPGEDTAAIPECSCKACSMLREDGIDTRSYGSNEHNMGRAAHNLNQLLRAHDLVLRERVGLVACSAGKLDRPAPARELYVSPLFCKASAWVEANCSRWFILSAKHGLVSPETILEPYNQTLGTMSADERAAWSSRVRWQLHTLALHNCRLVLLAGEHYAAPTAGLNVERPLQGLGIGQQLQWLKRGLAVGADGSGLQQELFAELAEFSKKQGD